MGLRSQSVALGWYAAAPLGQVSPTGELPPVLAPRPPRLLRLRLPLVPLATDTGSAVTPLQPPLAL